MTNETQTQEERVKELSTEEAWATFREALRQLTESDELIWDDGQVELRITVSPDDHGSASGPPHGQDADKPIWAVSALKGGLCQDTNHTNQSTFLKEGEAEAQPLLDAMLKQGKRLPRLRQLTEKRKKALEEHMNEPTPRFQFGRKPLERRHDIDRQDVEDKIERDRIADIPRYAQEPADKLAAELLALCQYHNVGSCAFTPDELLAEVVRIVSRTFRDGCTYDEVRLGLPPAGSSRTVPHLRRSNI